MGEKIIQIPRRLDRISSLLDLNIPTTDLSGIDRCIIDFTKCVFGEPLPMLLLGRELRSLVRKNRGKTFSCRTSASDFRGYADHVGFFQYCGFERGRSIGEANGSSTHVPIQLIDINALKEASGDRPYVEIVQEKSDELARVLLGNREHSSFLPIRYSIREIMRNSVEHSRGGVVVYFGQFWRDRNEAEIVIFDTGVGVISTLAEAGIVRETDGHQALRTALLPGVTGVSEIERRNQPEDVRNSGFGLYVTSRYCSEFGTFRILSKGHALTVNRVGTSEANWRFEGTCVQMKLKTNLDTSNGNRILEIVDEADAVRTLDGTARPASTASRSLDFFQN